MANTILGQRQAWRRNRTHVRVANQRKDGMVKGRSGYFDSSLLRRRGVRGQHFTQQRTLASDHEGLLLQGKSVTFFDQRRDLWIIQEKLIKPCDLRKHLQVSEVLRLKVFVRPFRRITKAAKSLPKGLVSRIAADHVHRVGLKEILQG